LGSGKVAVVVMVYPRDVNTDRSLLAEEIKKKLTGVAEVKKIDEEPIAFGLVALKLHMVVPEDIEGGTDTVESAISSLNLVSNIEVTHVYRI
jgi:elongation factor 1-beta